MSSLKSLLLLTTVGCFYAKSGDVAAVTMSSLKSLLLLTTVGCFYAKSGDVAACCHITTLSIKTSNSGQ